MGKNVCPCPDPPGGSAVCEENQLAICRVINGVPESECVDPPGGLARDQLYRWALESVTGKARSRVAAKDLQLLKSGLYVDARTGSKVTFKLPASFFNEARQSPARLRSRPRNRTRPLRSSDPLEGLTVRGPSEHGGYGWVRDLPDVRDFAYAAPLTRFAKGLPASVDLRPECPPVYAQGQLGSSTGNAIAGAIEFDQRKQGAMEFTPSRLFIYYNERVMEGTVNQDGGAQIRDGIKSVATLGTPPESEWPYDIAKFAVKPPRKAYYEATQDLVSVYARVAQNLPQMQGCLAEGYPFVFGFTVYDSFASPEVAQLGIVPMPSSGERVQGGHCVVAVGYDDDDRAFIVRNSWGNTWGKKGYCTMPYEYLLNAQLAADFWTMRSVT